MTRDIFILSISAVVIATCSIFLYLDYTSKVKRGDAKQIGMITFKRKIAERKYSGQVIWEELSEEAPLYNNDSIRTAEGSLSIIKLNSGDKIELDENTLILLSLTDKGTTIDFSQGSISAKSSSSKSKLNIMSAGTKVEIKNADVNLSKKNDQSISMNVTSGKAIVKTDKGSQDVSSDQFVVFSSKSAQVKDKTILLNYPVTNRHYITAGGSSPVDFSWKSKNNQSLLLEISKNKEFGTGITAVPVSGTTKRLSLSPDTYYWRIRSDSNQKEYSEARKFFIFQDRLAMPISPENNASFSYLQKSPMVSFLWSKSKLASSYMIEIATDRTMKNIIKTLNSNDQRIATDELNEGVYFWRIKHLYSSADAGPIVSAGVASFSIKKKKGVQKPYLLSPVENATISSIFLINNHMLFNWKENNDMSGFYLFLSKDQEGKQKVFEAFTKMNYYTLSGKFEPGTYYWGVDGVAENGRVSSVMRPIQFIKAREVSPVYPKNGDTMSFSATKGMINFTWNDPNRLNNYIFKISTDNNMQTNLHSQLVNKNSCSYVAPHGGKYYWSVELVDKQKQTLANSGIFSVNLSEHLAGPVGLSPVNWVIDMTSKNVLTFVWKEVSGATHYKIQLYHLIGGTTKKVFERDVTGNMTSLSNLSVLDKGKFAWDIQALKYYNEKLVSQSEIKRYYFSLTVQEPTQKPVIINPGVIYTQ